MQSSRLELITNPKNDAVNLVNVKKHLRIDATDLDEDIILDQYIKASIGIAQRQTNLQFITATYKAAYDVFPLYSMPIRVPRGHLISVDSITYYSTDSTPKQITMPTDNYRIPIGATPEIVPAINKHWPEASNVWKGIEIQFKAGYGDNDSDVPDEIKQAILLYVGAFYENREEVVGGGAFQKLPQCVSASMILSRHKILEDW